MFGHLLEDETESVSQARFTIPIPGLNQPYGSGDILSAMIGGFGIQTAACSPCQARKEKMNQFLAFTPYDANKDGGLG